MAIPNQWTQIATVQKGGRIEFDIPLLEEGSRVEVVVRNCAEISKRAKPVFGSAKGQGWIGSDFKEPLEEFKDYM
jgi:hypothetical protein